MGNYRVSELFINLMLIIYIVCGALAFVAAFTGEYSTHETSAEVCK